MGRWGWVEVGRSLTGLFKTKANLSKVEVAASLSFD